MCEFVVSTKDILDNLKKVKNKLKTNTKVCAVVKANAYGFCLEKIVNLIKEKVDYFAVARFDEFVELRKYDDIKPCLILSPLYDKELEEAIRLKAEITVSLNSDVELIDKLAQKYQVKAKIHLKVDTGMSRFGFNDFLEFKKALKRLTNLKKIEVVGLYSHFYNVEDKSCNLKQRSKFIFFKKLVNKYGFYPICHISSSKGIKDVLNQFDMVRLGFDLYHSNEHSLLSRVLEIKKLKRGECVGYSGLYKAQKDMFIAVCLGGYADGITRNMNKSYVLINGNKCKILGNICMDTFMVEVQKGKIKVNDKVTIFGKNQEKFISVCDLAKVCDTIPYEIYTGISNRVKRVYK